jgi:urea transport system permease protein
MLMLMLTAGGASPARGADATKPEPAAALLKQLTEGTPKANREALEGLAKTGDPRLVVFLRDHYMKGGAFAHGGAVVLQGKKQGDTVELLDPLTREPLKDARGALLAVPASELKELDVTNRERRWATASLAVLELAERITNPDLKARVQAIVAAGDRGEEASLPALRVALEKESNKKARYALDEAIARIEFERGAGEMIKRYQDARQKKLALRYEQTRGSDAERRKAIDAELASIDTALKEAGDAARHPEEVERRKTRVEWAGRLGDLRSLRAMSRIREAQAAETDPVAWNAYEPAIAKIRSWQRTVDWSGYLFSGISAGTILILVALGLSIIFGVMGVINMAQGELVMIGAYATYVTQLAFQRWVPERLYDWYFPLAIPVAFLVAAGIGMLMEATVVRRLYGRPLDTLLATFGIGLILTQAVRAGFGDNIGVKAPSYLQGSWEVVGDVHVPYARLFVIGFCAACVALMYVIINRTKLGLLLRATTQHRAMASALGVPTKRVDLYTFGLGAGLAGLAGCALSSIEGVTPNMGQNYIIDSFLVVVTGGVGKLAGAIWAGLGLGMVNKMLEPIFQTVWAKVIILGMVVVFLQWRPSGLFPAKGRLADA